MIITLFIFKMLVATMLFLASLFIALALDKGQSNLRHKTGKLFPVVVIRRPFLLNVGVILLFLGFILQIISIALDYYCK